MLFGKKHLPVSQTKNIWDDSFGLATYDRPERFWDLGAPYSVEETETEYLVSFDMPGVPKDKIKVELNDNVLTVSGEREDRLKKGKGKNAVSEYSYGSYTQSISLPSNVDATTISAAYEDGVLCVTLPRTSQTKARTIEIGAKKADKKTPAAAKTLE